MPNRNIFHGHLLQLMFYMPHYYDSNIQSFVVEQNGDCS